MSFRFDPPAHARRTIDLKTQVTIRFDTMSTVTRNRVAKALEDGTHPYGWQSKVTAVFEALGLPGDEDSYRGRAWNKYVPEEQKDVARSKLALMGYALSEARNTDYVCVFPRNYRNRPSVATDKEAHEFFNAFLAPYVPMAKVETAELRGQALDACIKRGRFIVKQ